MKSDRIVIACATLLALVYLYATEQIPALQIGDPMGAKAMPRLLGVLLLVSVGLLWLEGRLSAGKLSALPKNTDAVPAATEQRSPPVVLAVVAWTALYLVVFERLGFCLASAVYLFALMAWFNRGRWLANGLTALLFSLGSYLAFTKLLGVRLPAGLLPF